MQHGGRLHQQVVDHALVLVCDLAHRSIFGIVRKPGVANIRPVDDGELDRIGDLHDTSTHEASCMSSVRSCQGHPFSDVCFSAVLVPFRAKSGSRLAITLLPSLTPKRQCGTQREGPEIAP